MMSLDGKRLRILFVPHAYAPARGGTELLCQRVAESLVTHGHDVCVLTTNAGSVDSYYGFGIPPVSQAPTRLNGVNVRRVPLGAGWYEPLGRMAACLPEGRFRSRLESRALWAIRTWLPSQFGREIRRFEPDVVVTMPHLVVNVQAVLKVHREQPFPLVMLPLLHEEDPHWDTAAVRRALGQADAIVAITETERRRLISAYDVRAESVFLGGMGVDVPPAVPDTGRSRGSVIFIGRKIPEKGIPILLDAMHAVWRDHPDVLLVLAGARGAGTATIDAIVSALPDRYRSNVVSEDNVDDMRKSQLLAEATCLVLPSKIESFGGVLLESWAHSTPVITLDLPVFREIVEDGVDGVLVSPEDPARLASAICRILDHPAEATAMGRAGRRKAAASFIWENIAARYLEACQFAMQSFQSRGRVLPSTRT